MPKAMQMLLAGAWLAALCVIAYAQPAQTVRLRGTIENAEWQRTHFEGHGRRRDQTHADQ